MSAWGRGAAVVARAVLRLLPDGRRDWAEALWAESAAVPAGWDRAR